MNYIASLVPSWAQARMAPRLLRKALQPWEAGALLLAEAAHSARCKACAGSSTEEAKLACYLEAAALAMAEALAGLSAPAGAGQGAALPSHCCSRALAAAAAACSTAMEASLLALPSGSSSGRAQRLLPSWPSRALARLLSCWAAKGRELRCKLAQSLLSGQLRGGSCAAS